MIKRVRQHLCRSKLFRCAVMLTMPHPDRAYRFKADLRYRTCHTMLCMPGMLRQDHKIGENNLIPGHVIAPGRGMHNRALHIDSVAKGCHQVMNNHLVGMTSRLMQYHPGLILLGVIRTQQYRLLGNKCNWKYLIDNMRHLRFFSPSCSRHNDTMAHEQRKTSTAETAQWHNW